MMPNQPINNSSYLKVVPVIGIRSEAYENVTNIVLYVEVSLNTRVYHYPYEFSAMEPFWYYMKILVFFK